MGVTVNTTGTIDTRLTTIENVKLHLGIEESDAEHDDLLAYLIDAASATIVGHTHRDFARVNVTEKVPGSGTPKLLLTRRPLISITSVTYGDSTAGSTVSSTSYAIDDADAGILFKKTLWADTSIYHSFIEQTPLYHGRRDWVVQYTAGYILPNSTATQTLPRDVEHACVMLVKSWFLGRGEDPNVKFQRTGDAAESKFDQGSDLGIPPLVKTLLAKWRTLDVIY